MIRRRGWVPAILCLLGVLDVRAAGSGPDLSRKAQAYQIYLQAQTLLMERQGEAAADLLDRAIERDPAADLLLQAARLREAIGHLDRASALVDRALEARPGWSEALIERGDLALERLRSGGDAATYASEALEAYHAAIEADPDSPDATRAFAELSAQAGRIDQAIDSLESFGRRRSLPAPMRLLLARLYLRSGRPAEAQPLLEDLQRRSPESSEVIDLLAGVYEEQGRYDDAVALYAPLLDDAASRPALHERLGLLKLEGGHFQEAVTELETADRLDPANPEVLLLLVQAYDGADAIEKASAACDRLLSLRPDNLEALFQHARLLRRQGDSTGSRGAFEDLIKRAGDLDKPGERAATIITLAWAQIGVLAIAQKDWPAAEEALGKAVERAHDPRPDVLRLLVRAHLEAGSFERAEAVASTAAARFPEDLDLRALAGEILMARGDETGARASFRRLIDEEKGSSEAYITVSEALIRRHRYADAEAVLKEALRLRGEDDRLLFARGAVLERLGRMIQAERVLGRAVEVNPKNAMALNYLGYMLADSGRRLDESLAYVQRALALEPDNPAYLDSLGWALFKLARYQPAEENLRAALRYDRTDPAIREHLGDLLIATGRTEEAVREWQAALEYGHEEPARVREKMEKARATLKDAP